MESLRKIIREVIEETHTGQRDIEKFANNILKFMGQRCIDEYKSQLEYGADAKLFFLPILYTGKMTGEGYSEIGQFVEETSIKIVPVELIDKESTKGRLQYASPESNKGREYFEIKLKYEDSDLDKINELFSEKYPEITPNDVYFKLFYLFYSTLIHELQHAYDAWRSKGKAFDTQLNPNYVKQQDLASRLEKKAKEELTPEEIDALGNSYKAYLNLVHEINARYAQAMQKVRVKGIDDNFNDTLKTWDDVFRQFKLYFDGWRFLSDKMKKKLTRRVAKAYQEESENLKTAEQNYEKKELVGESYIRKLVRNSIKESFFEKRVVAGVLIKCVKTDNIFLLLRNDEQPNWALVSGTIDKGEDVLSGLKRELYEELFVKPSLIDFKFVRVENIPEKNIEFHYYEGYVENEFTPILDEENLDGKWFSREMLPKPLFKGLGDKIEKIYNNPELEDDSKSEELIGEAAMRLSDLPNTAALFIRPINQGHDLTIYDPSTKTVYGTITISYRDYYGPDYFVSGVAAERGFGPLIYEMAMMHISGEGKGLMPTRDGDVRSDAWNVWERFYNRGDIRKETLESNSPFFRFDILFSEDEFDSEEEKQDWIENEASSDDIKKLMIFNTVYSLGRNKEYSELLSRGEVYLSKGFDERKVISAAEDFWNEKY
jgi:ADP-ribose pyrophosphatase YjhB (NUDIX family)